MLYITVTPVRCIFFSALCATLKKMSVKMAKVYDPNKILISAVLKKLYLSVLTGLWLLIAGFAGCFCSAFINELFLHFLFSFKFKTFSQSRVNPFRCD